jgi:hypothetical protein
LSKRHRYSHAKQKRFASLSALSCHHFYKTPHKKRSTLPAAPSHLQASTTPRFFQTQRVALHALHTTYALGPHHRLHAARVNAHRALHALCPLHTPAQNFACFAFSSNIVLSRLAPLQQLPCSVVESRVSGAQGSFASTCKDAKSASPPLGDYSSRSSSNANWLPTRRNVVAA